MLEGLQIQAGAAREPGGGMAEGLQIEAQDFDKTFLKGVVLFAFSGWVSTQNKNMNVSRLSFCAFLFGGPPRRNYTTVNCFLLHG